MPHKSPSSAEAQTQVGPLTVLLCSQAGVGIYHAPGWYNVIVISSVGTLPGNHEPSVYCVLLQRLLLICCSHFEYWQLLLNTSDCGDGAPCNAPGEEMSLKGLKAFDAAAYCASITAAKRQLKDQSKRQRKQEAAAAQQQHAVEGSPHSDHDLGVRPEGPESPRAANWCDHRDVAHIHADSGGDTQSNGSSNSQVAAAESQAQTHAERAHAMFYTASSSTAQQQQQHVQQCSWWRRALTCMHIDAPQRSRG